MDILSFLQQQGKSRRNILSLLQQQKIFLNGQVIEYRKQKIQLGDTIRIQSNIQNNEMYTVEDVKEGGTIILFNKPIGYTVSKDDEYNQTIYDILPPEWKEKYTYIGRLDKDSHGLLVLTDILQLVHIFSHPSYGHQKTYIIQTDTPLSSDTIQAGAIGVTYYDKDTNKDISLHWDSCKKNGNNTYEVILSSGKKRHIRRLIEALGANVVDLQRVGFGPRNLGKDIAVGSRNTIQLEGSDLENLLTNQNSYIQKQT